MPRWAHAACLAATLLFALCGTGWTAVGAPVPPLNEVPEIVAEVDGQPITKRELIRELIAASGAAAFERILRRKLVEQSAKEMGIAVSDEELEQQLQYEKTNIVNDLRLAPGEIQGKRVTLEDMVRSRFNMSLEEYKRHVIRHKLIAKKVIGKDLQVTEQALRQFYRHKPYKENNLTVEEILQPQTRYRASHILITPLNPVDLYRGRRLMGHAGERARRLEEILRRGEEWYRERNMPVPDDPAQLRAKGEQWYRDLGIELPADLDLDMDPEWKAAYERAMEVKDELSRQKVAWDEAVRKHTQDPHDMRDARAPQRTIRDQMGLKPGEVGWFTRDGPLVDEFYEQARRIPKGAIGGPIKTRFGYHLVWMMDIDEPKRKSYDELRPQVKDIYIAWLLQSLTDQWMKTLAEKAAIERQDASLWPPDPKRMRENDSDPVIAKVNQEPIRRGEIWEELLRSDGPEALERLINREMALGPLKRLGPTRLDWESRPPALRPERQPPAAPIEVGFEEIDRMLTGDRLDLDKLNAARRSEDKNAPSYSLAKFIFDRSGMTLEEYRRSLEAGAVLAHAVRRKAEIDEARLRFEFAMEKDQYLIAPSWSVSHLLFKVDPGAAPGTRGEYTNMVTGLRQHLLEKKISWEDLEKAASESEKMVLLSEDSLRHRDLYEKVREGNWERGHVSPPIQTAAGVHLIKVLQRFPQRTPEFKEVRDKVERDYLRGRAQIFSGVWIRAMKKNAKVKRYIFETEELEIPEQLPLPK